MAYAENLPTASWSDIQIDKVYLTQNRLLVSFGKKQINLGKKYDPNRDHLKAINKGRVSPEGTNGLVSSQKKGFELKSKVLGKRGRAPFSRQIYRWHLALSWCHNKSLMNKLKLWI